MKGSADTYCAVPLQKFATVDGVWRLAVVANFFSGTVYSSFKCFEQTLVIRSGRGTVNSDKGTLLVMQFYSEGNKGESLYVFQEEKRREDKKKGKNKTRQGNKRKEKKRKKRKERKERKKEKKRKEKRKKKFLGFLRLLSGVWLKQ